MMSGRNVTYGYYMENGTIKINEAEAETIRFIFAERASGKGVKLIGKEMFEKGTDYFSGSEDKAMKKVSSVLYRKHYIGENGYPAIVDREIFETVGRSKGKRRKKARVCKADLLVSAKETEFEYIENLELRSVEREIEELLCGNASDRSDLAERILGLAAEKYKCITVRKNI